MVNPRYLPDVFIVFGEMPDLLGIRFSAFPRVKSVFVLVREYCGSLVQISKVRKGRTRAFVTYCYSFQDDNF